MNLIKKIKNLINKSSSEKYIKYLQSLGMRIGKNTSILSPNKSHIDEGRAKWISIGDNVVICSGVSILAHDYSWNVIRNFCHEEIPSGGRTVVIGNNVFIGENSIILRNVSIGDNVIIGAGSVVTKDIPSNSVVAGSPATIILPLDEFVERKRKKLLDEVKESLIQFKKINGVFPNEQQMRNFEILYLERNEKNFEKLRKRKSLSYDVEERIEMFKNTSPLFSSYEDMIEKLIKGE